MLGNYSRIRMLTDAYRDEHVYAGSVGYVVEVYPDDHYEIEFSDEAGTTITLIVVHGDEVELYPEGSEQSVQSVR